MANLFKTIIQKKKFVKKGKKKVEKYYLACTDHIEGDWVEEASLWRGWDQDHKP